MLQWEHVKKARHKERQWECTTLAAQEAALSKDIAALGAPADLLVAENSLEPWPSGHGEDPPPLGSVVRVDGGNGTRQVVATRAAQRVASWMLR